ncbi:MAG: amidohydrolase family protein [Acidimicrobiia bacterium]|nr:amidohydrolase family protein [Acidimicrobiia bacterium]
MVRGGQIFDGTGAPFTHGELAIEDGRIAEVGNDLDGDAEIDVSGKSIVPGFIDCHVHIGFRDVDFIELLKRPFALKYFETAHNLATTLDTGITTARDAGGASLGIKTAVEQGLVRGPRLRLSLTMISQSGGHGDGWMPSGFESRLFALDPGIPKSIVDSPDEMRRVVREIIRAGADNIKVATSGGVMSPRSDPTRPHLSPAELEVLVAEANAAGVHVLAHAQATQGIRNAVEAGIHSIEHGIFLDEPTVELMKQTGTWLVPTLMAPRGVLDAADRGINLPDWALRKAEEVLEAHKRSVRLAIEAGVKIAFGTDSPVSPHGTNLGEFALMQELGMSPLQVLRAATGDAATLVRVIDDVGTLHVGKRADFVVIDGDPLDFTDYRERITAVYKDGRHVGGPDFHGRLTA